ncbi:signal peptidase I [Bacteroidota bacterium]
MKNNSNIRRKKTGSRKLPDSAGRKFVRQLKEILFTALTVWLVTAAIIEGSRVPTGSMENTIMIGDYLLINKFIYGPSTPRYIPLTDISLPYIQFPSIREPERNDIIVFEYPGDRDELFVQELDFYVKRCIGIPGDTVRIFNKLVYLNGEQFPIPVNIQYLSPQIKPYENNEPAIFPVGVPGNGDNYSAFILPKEGDEIKLTRENIEKWRNMIDREQGARVVNVIGKDIFINGIKVTKYKFCKDYYFMMGDNRDNSADSRYWGPVPRDKIVGTPIIALWSWNSDIPWTEPLRLLGSIRWDRIAKIVK